jgi:polyhydroxyalkanoate synthase
LLKGTATVGDKPVECADVAMPVLSVSAEKDTIAPAAGVDAVRNIVPHAEILRLPGGHVGIVAGRSAATLWKRTVEFLGEGVSSGET